MKLTTRIGLAACAILGAAVPASANHSWGGYHWANGTTGQLVVKRALSSANWTTLVNAAMADWEGKPLSFAITDAPAGTSRRKCSPSSGQTLICNDSYGQRGWLGIASIWASGVHITQATTKLNDTYFNMTRYNDDAWRRMVACQEVGHNWGLDHQDEAFGNVNLGTCMDYTNAPAGGVYNNFNYGPSNVRPNNDDYSHLTGFYNHPDSIAAATNFGVREVGRPVISDVPAGFNSAVGETAAEWGRAIHRDSKGRPDVFEKDFGNGFRRLTHVFWALEARGNEAN